MPVVDIITVYNNVELFQQMKGSAEQNGGFSDVNFIGLDNTAGQFKSAAQAYNYALDNLCTGDILVFCHQDIVFGERAILDLAEICMADQNVLFGAAGVKLYGKIGIQRKLISSMWQGHSFKYNSLGYKEQQEVMTLDECLIAAHHSVFQQVRFDEVLCDSWHLYAVDFSLQCHLKNIRVMAYDANITHLSGGKIDSSFRRCEKKLAKKWSDHYSILVYPCGWCYTNVFLFFALRCCKNIWHLLRRGKKRK